MFWTFIILLVITNSLALRIGRSWYCYRIGIVLQLYCIIYYYNSLFISNLDIGVGLFGGLFNKDSLVLDIDLLIFTLTMFILNLTGFYVIKSNGKKSISLNRILATKIFTIILVDILFYNSIFNILEFDKIEFCLRYLMNLFEGETLELCSIIGCLYYIALCLEYICKKLKNPIINLYNLIYLKIYVIYRLHENKINLFITLFLPILYILNFCLIIIINKDVIFSLNFSLLISNEVLENFLISFFLNFSNSELLYDNYIVNMNNGESNSQDGGWGSQGVGGTGPGGGPSYPGSEATLAQGNNTENSSEDRRQGYSRSIIGEGDELYYPNSPTNSVLLPIEVSNSYNVNDLTLPSSLLDFQYSGTDIDQMISGDLNSYNENNPNLPSNLEDSLNSPSYHDLLPSEEFNSNNQNNTSLPSNQVDSPNNTRTGSILSSEEYDPFNQNDTNMFSNELRPFDPIIFAELLNAQDQYEGRILNDQRQFSNQVDSRNNTRTGSILSPEGFNTNNQNNIRIPSSPVRNTEIISISSSPVRNTEIISIPSSPVGNTEVHSLPYVETLQFELGIEEKPNGSKAMLFKDLVNNKWVRIPLKSSEILEAMYYKISPFELEQLNYYSDWGNDIEGFCQDNENRFNRGVELFDNNGKSFKLERDGVRPRITWSSIFDKDELKEIRKVWKENNEAMKENNKQISRTLTLMEGVDYGPSENLKLLSSSFEKNSNYYLNYYKPNGIFKDYYREFIEVFNERKNR